MLRPGHMRCQHRADTYSGNNHALGPHQICLDFLHVLLNVMESTELFIQHPQCLHFLLSWLMLMPMSAVEILLILLHEKSKALHVSLHAVLLIPKAWEHPQVLTKVCELEPLLLGCRYFLSDVSHILRLLKDKCFNFLKSLLLKHLLLHLFITPWKAPDTVFREVIVK